MSLADLKRIRDLFATLDTPALQRLIDESQRSIRGLTLLVDDIGLHLNHETQRRYLTELALLQFAEKELEIRLRQPAQS